MEIFIFCSDPPLPAHQIQKSAAARAHGNGGSKSLRLYHTANEIVTVYHNVPRK
jgi:hypothetical protein